MAGVRVLVQVEMASAEAIDAAIPAFLDMTAKAKPEPGAIEYEVFRSLEEPRRLVVLEHWASKELYDKHWTDQVARDGLPDQSPFTRVDAEFYVHAIYDMIDGIWQPRETADRMSTIRWA